MENKEAGAEVEVRTQGPWVKNEKVGAKIGVYRNKDKVPWVDNQEVGTKRKVRRQRDISWESRIRKL